MQRDELQKPQLNIATVLATGVFIIQGNKITFQRANYIEDGWYVEQIDEDIMLWEIPYGGGATKSVWLSRFNKCNKSRDTKYE